MVERGMNFTRDWFTDRTGSWLTRLRYLREIPDARGLEIGSYEGRSAVWTVENILTGPGSILTCVDPWSETAWERWKPRYGVMNSIRRRFYNNTAKYRAAGRIVPVQMRSNEFFRRASPGETYDFVYVDGCHTKSQALNDMRESWIRLRPGGAMVVDDVTMKSVLKACESWLTAARHVEEMEPSYNQRFFRRLG